MRDVSSKSKISSKKKQNQLVDNKRKLQDIKNIIEEDSSHIREIIDLIPIGVCITNLEGNFIQVNKRCCEIYKYKSEELLHQHFTKIIPEEYKEELSNLYAKSIENREEIEAKWEVVDKEGNKKKIFASTAFLETENKGPQKITFITDITDLDESEENLKATIQLLEAKMEAQHLSEQLMLHDLRNPVANILSIADILKRKGLDQETDKWIDLIKELAHKSLNLLQSSTDLAKMESGIYVLKIEDINVTKLLDEILKQNRQLLSKYNVKGMILVNGKKPTNQLPEVMIQGDRLYIEQMFNNLIVNAIEASPANEQITIDIIPGQYLSLKIHNHGIVPEGIKDRLFEKNVTSGKKKGRGLGAYFSKLIAEQHQASISFTSSKSEGTTFTVKIPTKQ